MRKTSRTMMIIVSVLLSLVLITSTVVSGTLAKYTTTGGESSDSARVAKWGVNVEVKLDPAFAEVVGSENIESVANGDSVTINISNLKMGPGDDFSKALNVSLSGKSEVRLKVNVDIDIAYESIFIIPKGKFGVTEEGGTGYFPVGLTLGCNDVSGEYVNDYMTVPRNSVKSAGLHDNLILFEFSRKTSMNLTGIYGKDLSAEAIFEPNKDIVFHPKKYDNTVQDFVPVESVSINEFDLGFVWPFENENDPLTNKKDTYLILNNDDLSFEYSLTVTVEQIS